MEKGEMRRHPWEDPENMRFGLRTLGLGQAYAVACVDSSCFTPLQQGWGKMVVA